MGRGDKRVEGRCCPNGIARRLLRTHEIVESCQWLGCRNIRLSHFGRDSRKLARRGYVLVLSAIVARTEEKSCPIARCYPSSSNDEVLPTIFEPLAAGTEQENADAVANCRAYLSGSWWRLSDWNDALLRQRAKRREVRTRLSALWWVFPLRLLREMTLDGISTSDYMNISKGYSDAALHSRF